MFKEGQTVIDTTKRQAVEIVCILYSSIKTIYVVENVDDECYIVTENRLIEYDKHWFDIDA